MTPNQTDNVIVGYRKATDAQQRIIQELRSKIARLQAGGCARDQSTTQFCAEAVEMRDEISILREQIETRDRHMNVCRGRTKCPADEVLAEWLKGFVRLDDPVILELVEIIRGYQEWVPAASAKRALDAYESRVKEVSRE